jgi:hypothetical protein
MSLYEIFMVWLILNALIFLLLLFRKGDDDG